ncbi:MAG: RecX family transcriptional regulator [Nitrospira sp.]|nr:RecX family transcriptional regulator [Nitrospira sp.]MDH4249976.1 RecX family transcriptional regulator [Nitrospira sp.]MDH4343234.1 RecX family transcriptional regulator [Nitrospira sp.]MDH5336249.1 RecX family transcriptional regulator [Nitrospira sp.]
MPLAIRFLARCDRTVAQVEQFLRSKGALPGQIRYTIRRLSDLQYLNDQAYAQRWVERRLVSRPMGPARIKAELQAKGITETVADRVIADAFREVGEERMARRALNARQRHGSRLTPAQSVRLLRQRGFDEETIDRIVMVACSSDEG